MVFGADPDHCRHPPACRLQRSSPGLTDEGHGEQLDAFSLAALITATCRIKFSASWRSSITLGPALQIAFSLFMLHGRLPDREFGWAR